MLDGIQGINTKMIKGQQFGDKSAIGSSNADQMQQALITKDRAKKLLTNMLTKNKDEADDANAPALEAEVVQPEAEARQSSALDAEAAHAPSDLVSEPVEAVVPPVDIPPVFVEPPSVVVDDRTT